jgi:hypothetical protein
VEEGAVKDRTTGELIFLAAACAYIFVFIPLAAFGVFGDSLQAGLLDFFRLKR